MLNSIKIPTYREVVFLSVEVLFPTALSFNNRLPLIQKTRFDLPSSTF